MFDLGMNFKTRFQYCKLLFSSTSKGSQANGEIVCGQAEKLFALCFAGHGTNSTKLLIKYHSNIPLNREEIGEYCKSVDIQLKVFISKRIKIQLKRFRSWSALLQRLCRQVYQ